METPESGHQHVRSMRNHTPKLSERKKKLFETTKGKEVDHEESELLSGIEPLPKSKSRTRNRTPKSTKIVESSTGSCKKTPRAISFFETESEEGDTAEEQKPSPSRRSVRLSLKKTLKPESENSTSPHKENIPIKTPTHREAHEDKQLQKMFNNSMQITPRNKSMVVEETSSEDEINSSRNSSNRININKRNYEIVDSTGFSPSRKVAKTVKSPTDAVSISTASFYSVKNRNPQTNSTYRPSCRNLFGHSFSAASTPSRSKQPARRSLGLQSASINRGVHHKVRKRPNNLSLTHKHYAPVDIDQILNNVRNEKLRRLITAKREERQQIEKIHNILRTASNPIAMARPLSSISNHDDANNNLSKDSIEQQKTLETPEQANATNSDFSDIECDEEIENGCEQSSLESTIMDMHEEVIPLITYQTDDNLSVKSEDTSPPVKRRFFKSGRTTTTRKEVYLTDNIKATVAANGKISIIPEKKKIKKRLKIRSSEFSDEQATVDAILRNLDDTAFGDVVLPKDHENQNIITSCDNTILSHFDDINQQLALIHEDDSSNPIDDIVVQDDNQNFHEFRNRLPYNTTDPEIIERQHLLLDFLITNNICTEENFNIFIADPDNHKAEAEKVIDDLVIIVTDHQNTDFRQRIPYNTTDPALIEQQHNFLDFLLENNICTEENFDIFIANYSEKKTEADALISQYAITLNDQYAKDIKELVKTSDEGVFLSQKEINSNREMIQANNSLENTNKENAALAEENFTTILSNTNNEANAPSTSNTIPQDALISSDQQKLFPVFYPGACQPLPQNYTRRKQPRLWNAGYGLNQYQIDAGQKKFGAHQCKQCGLVYTIHEPEEEKLHRDFHASLHILRFKGWIDEDIVAIYPEWGADGRILRLSEASAFKRRERLLEILKIVDKELGFSSYVMPKTFVAYLAVRKMQIVGLCLVQPLTRANKFVYVNGLDCCTEEQFDAKCGISRIWVSPLHRRLHIGSRLIQAVQLNTIFGEEIPLSEIAFSAPTELGKKFAQTITKTENFLVYQ